MSRKIAIPEAELRRLYEVEHLSQSEIALRYGCEKTAVANRMREYGVRARTNAQAVILSREHAKKRQPFVGTALEKGYLMGFCKGDAHVSLTGAASETIVVRTGSTRDEQVALFREVFAPYSHLWISQPDKRGAVNMAAFLDLNSFAWLLQRADAIPDEILSDGEAMLGFLAGYVDAEGHVGVYHRPVFTIESCDGNVLARLHEFLCQRGAECRPPRITKCRGTARSDSDVYQRDYWCLAVSRRDDLERLLVWLWPHIRHPKRKRDFERALSWLRERKKGVG
jgi:hypothetical protein